MDTPAKIIYEWVLTLSKGEDVILTENQYLVFQNQMFEDDTRKIFFEDVGFNPSFVTTWSKRPAIYIRNKYPCRTCHQGGYDKKGGWCGNCGGSGVDLPKKT